MVSPQKSKPQTNSAAQASAESGNVRGVDVESGALVARTQDEGAVWTALRTRTPRAVLPAGRTMQRLPDAALGTTGSGSSYVLRTTAGATRSHLQLELRHVRLVCPHAAGKEPQTARTSSAHRSRRSPEPWVEAFSIWTTSSSRRMNSKRSTDTSSPCRRDPVEQQRRETWDRRLHLIGSETTDQLRSAPLVIGDRYRLGAFNPRGSRRPIHRSTPG